MSVLKRHQSFWQKVSAPTFQKASKLFPLKSATFKPPVPQLSCNKSLEPFERLDLGMKEKHIRCSCCHSHPRCRRCHRRHRHCRRRCRRRCHRHMRR